MTGDEARAIREQLHLSRAALEPLVGLEAQYIRSQEARGDKKVWLMYALALSFVARLKLVVVR